MLKPNRSSSSLTPIEINTETEYDLGRYDNNLKMSHIAEDSRSSPYEGNNMVKIKVMHSVENEADNDEVDDDDAFDDDIEDDEMDKTADDFENTYGDIRENVDNEMDGSDDVRYSPDAKYDDGNGGSVTRHTNRVKTPVNQDKIRLSKPIAEISNVQNAITNKSPKDCPSTGEDSEHDRDNGNSPANQDNQLEKNVAREENQHIEEVLGGTIRQTRDDDEDRSEPTADKDCKPYQHIQSHNNDSFYDSSCDFKTLHDEKDEHPGTTDNTKSEVFDIGDGKNDLNDSHDVEINNDNDHTRQGPDISVQFDFEKSNEIQDTEKKLTDDFFDKRDSVELSYFASFNEIETSSGSKQENKINIETHDNSENIDHLSLNMTVDADKNTNTDKRSEEMNNLNFSTANESLHSNDKPSHSISGSIVPERIDANSKPSPEYLCDSLMAASFESTTVDDQVYNFVKGANQSENIETASRSPTKTQHIKTVVDKDDIDSNGKDDMGQENQRVKDSLSANSNDAEVSSDITVIAPVAIQNPSLKMESIGSEGDNGNEREIYIDGGGSDNEDDVYMNDDYDDCDKEKGISEKDEFHPLSEPDEQSILRVFISKNDQDEPAFDIISEIPRSLDDTNDNIGQYGSGNSNTKKGKTNQTIKPAKHTQKDKKNNLQSPHSNSIQSINGNSRALDRLKNGPYAEVFKRDIPNVPQTSKKSQENVKRKNKSNEKSKNEITKKERKIHVSAQSQSKTKIKGKTLQLKNKSKNMEINQHDHVDTSSTFQTSTHNDSVEESLKQTDELLIKDLCSVDKEMEINQIRSQETAPTNNDKPDEGRLDISLNKQPSDDTGINEKSAESNQNIPQVIIDDRAISPLSIDVTNSGETNQQEQEKEMSMEVKETTKSLQESGDNSFANQTESKDSTLEGKTTTTDHNIADPTAKCSPVQEANTKTVEENETTNEKENKQKEEKSVPFLTNKTSKAIADKQKQSQLGGFSTKKKIVISSPKTTAKIAMKSKLMSEKSKDSPKIQTTKVNKKSDQKSKERKISDVISPENDLKKQSDVVEPATITVIDETSELDERIGGRAGRLIINNIKNKLKRNSLNRHASNSSVTPIQVTTNSRPSSPDEKGLNTSASHHVGRAAYKTQSMSSLQVPGHLSSSNPWDPTKEEDALSIGSRRPSMDSVSRKSVDYRIRNTAMVIQPNNDEKPKSVFTSDETYIQSAVPRLPMGLAVFCLILNVVVPGSGTILSGLSVLCCGHSRLSNKEDQMLNSLCANLFVGIAQLFTVSFLLVGWFWSISWGIKMVSVSARYREELKQQREKDLQAMALSAFGSPKRMNLFAA